jgi:ABC-type uncharacterized transport system permease subunit
MKKIILGIILFIIQISLALFYNDSIDLKIVLGITILTFAFILYKLKNKKITNETCN